MTDSNGGNREPSTVGLTIRDLVLEVRTSVQAMREDLAAFKPTVVTKEDFDLHLEAQKATRRWSLGVIISVVASSASAVSVILANT